MDLAPGKDGLEVGVNICTPADCLSVEDYLKLGATFISYD